MNKNIQEALQRQKFRRMHKAAAKKSRLLKEQEHNLYTTFVQPFTDIIDAAKLTGQDILSAVRLQFDLLFSLSPEAMERAMDRYDKRAEAIGKKWDPIMKRNEAALESGDADLLAMVYAPAFFLTSEAAVATYNKAEDIYDYLDQSGWRIPLAGALFGGRPPQGSGGGSSRETSGAEPGKEKSLLAKLAGLFYFEAAWHEGEIILEQEEKDAVTVKKEKPPFEEAMKEYLEQTGLADQFAADAKEMLEGQKEMLEEVTADVLPKLQLITALTQTADVNQFIQAIESAEAEGLDLQAAGMDKVKQGVEEASEKLSQSEEFKQKTAEEAGVEVEDLPEDKLKEAAQKVAFVNAKQAFDKQAVDGKTKLVDSAIAFIDEKLPNSEIDIQAMKSSKIGIEALKLIEDTKQKLKNA